jgi:hypothetical protein
MIIPENEKDEVTNDHVRKTRGKGVEIITPPVACPPPTSSFYEEPTLDTE